MKAFRKYGNTFIQFDVTTSPTGEPLLPQDATLQDKPEGVPDYRLRIIGGEWIIVPEETYVLTFEQRKREKSNQINTWKHLFMDSFLIYNGRPLDFDDKSRNNMNGAYLGWKDFDDPTEAWKDANNQLYPVKDFGEITNMSKVFLRTYKERFAICARYEMLVENATNEDELNSIIPLRIPTLNEINRHLTYGTPLPNGLPEPELPISDEVVIEEGIVVEEPIVETPNEEEEPTLEDPTEPASPEGEESEDEVVVTEEA